MLAEIIPNDNCPLCNGTGCYVVVATVDYGDHRGIEVDRYAEVCPLCAEAAPVTAVYEIAEPLPL